MNNMKIQVQHTCPSCSGTGVMPNPEHNPNDIFPQSMLNSCMHCNGNKVVTEWIDVEHFLKNIAELDIQF
jgi:DnaJ-class molecular chaperone